MSTLVHLLKAIADDKSLLLFNTIANSNGDTEILSASGKGELPQEQFCLIIDKLLANQEIKDILLKHFKGGESSVYKNQETAISV